jgi:hypothetical protein
MEGNLFVDVHPSAEALNSKHLSSKGMSLADFADARAS